MSRLSEKIISIMTPSVGAYISRNILLLACKKENLDMDEISKESLSKIAAHVEELVSIRLQPLEAKKLAEKINSL
ncbi:hypothetical protein JXB41_07160 [Candidatus Woesearchaeota archaeon]|nr:hypothetical protein [Candidatus Woesearchaeota archaeon]